jgi:hypothetical protein
MKTKAFRGLTIQYGKNGMSLKADGSISLKAPKITVNGKDLAQIRRNHKGNPPIVGKG